MTQRLHNVYLCLAPMRPHKLLLSAQHRPSLYAYTLDPPRLRLYTGPPTFPKAERPEEDDELVALYLTDSKLTSDNIFRISQNV
jgi:hypothetical protein